METIRYQLYEVLEDFLAIQFGVIDFFYFDQVLPHLMTYRFDEEKNILSKINRIGIIQRKVALLSLKYFCIGNRKVRMTKQAEAQCLVKTM